MKRYIISAAASLMALLAVGSCSELNDELDKGQDTLTISLSNSNLVLSESTADSEALSISWSSGNNGGTGSAISYALELRPNDNDNLVYSIDIGRRVYKYSFTHAQLNDIATDEFGASTGSSFAMTATIVANVSGYSEMEQRSSRSFGVEAYEPLTETLYIMGSANSGGSDASSALEMTRSTAGLFTFSGNLVAGDFVLIPSTQSETPCYASNSGSQESLLYSDTTPADKFTISDAGLYYISVNLFTLSITISKVDAPAYSNIYFVGSFNSWGFTELTQMTLNKFQFFLGIELKSDAGGYEFKFGTSSGSFDNMYHPSIANAPYTHSSVTFNGDDNKWVMQPSECDKAYKMTLDITTGAESFTMVEYTPYANMWMLGDATPNGWSMDDATELSTDSYTSTWTGNLTAGQMKFTCDKDTNWNGAYYISSVDNEGITLDSGEEVELLCYFRPAGGSEDRKWHINNAGNYTITFNQLTQKVTFKRN